MKTRTWMLSGAAAVGAVALLAWAFAPRPLEVEVATATQGHFETTIDEDGKTRLRERYVVSAPLAGLLARITLREGDTVDANAVVATLTPVLSPMLDERSLRELIATRPTEEFRGIYLEGGLQPTRKNVLLPGSLGVYTGGSNYNPAQVLRDSSAAGATSGSRLLLELGKHLNSSTDWYPCSFVSIRG